MRQILFSILILLPALSAQVSSEIIESYDLKAVSEHFQNLDSESLLLWDVDETLIIAADLILKPGNEAVMYNIENHYFNDKSTQERRWLVSNIFHRMPFCLVEADVLPLISDLQQKSIPMLCLTAMRTGPYGAIDSMEVWRVNQLRKLGIDFSALFPQHSPLEWEETLPYKGYPAFKEGIICCDRVPKGIVLTTFLQKIDWRPNKVLFIDNDSDYLASVEEAMEALNIPFIGIHYRAVETMIPEVDEELAHHQFEVLVTEEIWLSDAEAKAAMQAFKEAAN